MDRLGTLLAPVTVEEFLRDFYEKKALHIPGTASKFKGVFDWNALNRALNSTPYPHPEVKFSGGSGTTHPKDAVAAIEEIKAGATLIFENIDRYDPNLGDFLDGLSSEIGEATRVNMYLSYPEKPGYRLHYDTQDFFILQVYGYKHWRIFPSTIDSPLFFQKRHGTLPPPLKTLYMDVTLGPGDLLYVPRGHWHDALAEQEPSLHLTMSVFVRNGIDFLTWVVDEMREDPFFRRNMPLAIHQMEFDDQHDVIHRNRIEQFRERLQAKLAEPNLLSEFRRSHTARLKSRAPFNFPGHFFKTPDDLPSSFHRRPYPSDIALRDGKLELVAEGRLLRFSSECKSLIELVFANEDFTLDDILSVDSSLSAAQRKEVLVALTREGLIIGTSH